MRKKARLSILFLIILVTGFIFSRNYLTHDVVAEKQEMAAGSTMVSSWAELTSAVATGNYDTIFLKNDSSSNWVATGTITIMKNTSIQTYGGNAGTLSIIRGTDKVLFDVKGGIFHLDGQNKGLTVDGSYSTPTQSLISVNSSAQAIITKVSLKNNNSTGNGGAVVVSNARLQLDGCMVAYNTANFGGGVFVENKNSKLIINDTNITQNQSRSGSGGGVYAYGNVTINNSTFLNNKAATYGGGLMVKTNATISNSTFNNNIATANAGGGIRVDGLATMNGGSVTNNKSNEGGAGVDFISGEGFTKKNVTLSGNLRGTEEVNINPDLEGPNNVDWKKDSSLKIEEIPFNLLKSYKTDGTGDFAPHSGATQGMTMTDKYILLVQWTANEEPTTIHVLDKNNLALKNSIVFDTATNGYTLGHANDMAYDKKTGFVYVYSGHKVDNKVQLVRFKIDKNGQMTDLSTLDAPRGISGIAVDNDHDQFIVYSGGKIFIYDKDFNEKKSFSVPTKLTTQGIGYWKGYVYFTCYEAGVPTIYQTVFNFNERKSNLIYMYDLEGNLAKTLYLSNKVVAGEIESVEFYDNGEMLFNYNYEGISLFKSNYSIQIKDVSLNTKPTKLTYIQNKDNIDLSGLVLGVRLNNEDLQLMNKTSEVTVEGFDNSILGEQTVNLVYKGKKIPLQIEILVPPAEEKNPSTGGVTFKVLATIFIVGMIGFIISKRFRRLYRV